MKRFVLSLFVLVALVSVSDAQMMAEGWGDSTVKTWTDLPLPQRTTAKLTYVSNSVALDRAG